MKQNILKVFSLMTIAAALSACTDAGNVSEPKTVEDMAYTITLQDYTDDGDTTSFDVSGTYTGEIVNGIPNGTGSFTAENDSGISYTYMGEFENGTFNGRGSLQWDDDSSFVESGTYTDGLFTPTTVDFYVTAQSIYQNSTHMSEKCETFLSEHASLFPCATEEDQSTAYTFVDDSITYAKLNKNMEPFGDRLAEFHQLTVSQIFETSNFYGHDLTWILAYDNDMNYYAIYYDGTVDVYDDDTINVLALPLGQSSFDNVSGGTTLIVAFAGSLIEKA